MDRTVNRREALGILGGAVAALPFAAGQARAARRDGPPNIVFIMTDDQRQDAMSAYGNRILRTPGMDRVGAGGVRFEQSFVTNSLCAPSRASTGRRAG